MARIRSIKPEAAKNEELARCSHGARLLFLLLPCWADRSGRLEDRPQRIKAEIFPYEEVNCDELLTELSLAVDTEGVPLIRRYKANGKAYIEIVKFKKHQQPHVKESASTIPAPDENQTSTELAPDKEPTQPPCLGNGLGNGIPLNPPVGGRVRFAPPTREEVRAEAQTIGLPEDQADTFFDHFESNGWKVGGKAPMKKWRSALYNWFRRWKAQQPTNGHSVTRKRGQKWEQVH